ncbi:carbohydrate ABC transporter permease [Thorsellia anophelis]|uniref:Carbohydrate ABC transporter membrane protein 1, CUT1 family (TC 3.A.1.1.-) n=1 Tax=Thorsellia anophelis DSM 18579 TaxID=1123402 RepID=A0A1H9ZWT6_9GAMM|nr:sugar ABC transporter permease [Thorsellia anophelis]SES86269.1 carbohydrate ABC transporter membrane protein 1, CUT1 family (TC 3.A.1.1.-) [Thorsellia anophelis DSM 18579]
MNKNFLAKLFLSPSVIVTLVCVYGYIFFTAFLSFTASKSIPNFTFVGFANYERLMKLDLWWLSVSNLAIFGSLFILCALVLGLLLAILIDQKIRAESLFRSLFLYPLALSLIVTGTAWKWLLDPGVGIENTIRTLGFESFNFAWIKSNDLAIYCVVIAAVWQTTGFVMAMFLAGLRGVDSEQINAAKIDGAPTWQIYWRIIIPQLGPVFISAFVVMAHMAIKSYDLVIALTNGGPGRSTWLPSVFMYQFTYARDEMGVGAASSVLMLLATAIIIIPYLIRELRQAKND